MSASTSLSVIVPVYNEQYLIEASLTRLKLLGESPLIHRIKVIVVDDCATDETPAALRRFQASIPPKANSDKFDWVFLRHEHNQGKGAAVRTGLRQADTEITVIHDADLEYHPQDLLKMIPLFLQNDADAVFGSRFLSSEFKRALFFRHALGNNLLTFLCNLASDLSLTDMETCYKMVRTRLLQSIPIESSDFRIEPELTIKLAKRGAIVFEVPISYAGRTYQEGKKINWRDGVRALGAILKYRVSDRLYTEDHPSGAMSLRLSRAPRFMRWIADMVRPFLGERVLEIGAGIGNLTVHLIPRTLYWATDRDSLCVDQLRKLQSVRPYLRVSEVDVMQLDPALAEQQFDTVICYNVIEKVEDDVAALRSIRGVLTAGGRTVVLVPRGAGLYGSLDRTLGHYRRYSREQLSQAGEQAGFRVCEVRQFNRAGTPAWWLNGRVLQRKTIGIWQIKLLNLLVPVLRRVDRWLPFPALSLMIVFENESPGST